MADILETSMSGLLAYQSALVTTSHNIANVNTEGYSRQRVVLGTLPAERAGGGYIGRGVQVESISRVLDQHRVDQLRVHVAEQGRLGTLGVLASSLSGTLGGTSTGLATPLQQFYDSLQQLADDPSATGVRQAALGQANILADRFSTLGGQLAALDVEVDARLGSAVREANGLASTIAELNLAIVGAGEGGGGVPNDLLDQRDLALRQLSEQLAISVVEQGDGSVSVFAGNGQALVLGADASTLALLGSEFPGSGARIGLATPGNPGSPQPMQDLSGGNIGGLLDFRREMLTPARNELGMLAVRLTETFNAQHALGLDLDGALGADFFSNLTPEVVSSTGNSGAFDFSVTVVDADALSISDYLLEYDGSAYTLTRTDSGQSVALSGSGTVADPFTGDGLSIVVNTPPAAGDRFLVRPTANAATDFGVELSDARQLAAAVPVVATAATGNSGSGRIYGETVLDPDDPGLFDTVTIEFASATTYSINGSGAFAYAPGAAIEVNGWRVSIDGAPGAGDTFTVASNAGGVGDNRNALGLIDAFAPAPGTGAPGVQAEFADLVGVVSAGARQVDISLTAQTAITEQNIAEQLAISGVNLDEEAANMLAFQQSYQAMSQMIGVADTLFQTLLAATRR